MAFKVVYEIGTRTVLVIDPLIDDQGNVTLPTGVQAAVATLQDSQRAAFSTPNARFRLLIDLVTVEALTQPSDGHAAIRDQIVASAQSAAGVLLSDLTAGQRNALLACLLYKAGGVGDDGKVNPLSEWMR